MPGIRREPFVAEPFWLGGMGGDHLLCVSGCDSYEVAPLQANCRSAVIDPQRLNSCNPPWRVVGATSDWKTLLVVRGDSLAVVDVHGNRAKASVGPVVRFQLELQTWGGEFVQHPVTPSQGEQKLTCSSQRARRMVAFPDELPQMRQVLPCR